MSGPEGGVSEELFGYETSGRRINPVLFDNRAHDLLQPVRGLAGGRKSELPGTLQDIRCVDGDDGVAVRRLHHQSVTEFRVRHPHACDPTAFIVGDERFHHALLCHPQIADMKTVYPPGELPTFLTHTCTSASAFVGC